LWAKLNAGQQISFPVDAPEDARTVSARWICDVARKQIKIDLINAVIVELLELPYATCEHEMLFSHCDFKQSVELSHLTAKQHISISCSRFESGIILQDANLQGNVDFSDVEIIKGKPIFADMRVGGGRS
jgi:hypothetical protein